MISDELSGGLNTVWHWLCSRRLILINALTIVALQHTLIQKLLGGIPLLVASRHSACLSLETSKQSHRCHPPLRGTWF